MFISQQWNYSDTYWDLTAQTTEKDVHILSILLITLFNCSGFVSNEMGQQVVTAYMKEIPRHLPGETEENMNNNSEEKLNLNQTITFVCSRIQV
jgi:hypothetical protein